VIARLQGQEGHQRHLPGDAFFDAAFLRGTTRFLMDMVDDPRLVHELIEVTLSYNLRATQRMIQAGCDVVVFGDDYADKNSR